MIVSTCQPYFAPYPGFFYKAHLSDLFVILDTVQFPRGTTWITRNRFKNDQGAMWLTVPVWKKGLGFQKINQVRICHEGRWAAKHLESLKIAYGHAPFLEDHISIFNQIFSRKTQKAADLNIRIIRHITRHLRMNTKLVLLSSLGLRSRGSQLLIDICKTTGADRFLAQNSAKKFINADLFNKKNISLEFVKIPSPVYPQLWGEFIPDLSAFDLLLNCGPKSHHILFSILNIASV